MRIVRYILEHKVAVVLIVALLVVQAFCDLSIPTYTGDIVNVGIQQSGVTHPSPDRVLRGTLDEVCLLLPDDQADLVRSSYDGAEGDGSPDDALDVRDITQSERSSLDDAMERPMVVLWAAQRQGADLSQAFDAYNAGQVSRGQVQAAFEQAEQALDGYDPSMVRQQAVAAAADAMSAAGVDLEQVRMDYLLRTGALMLGLTLLGAAVSVAVSFLASNTGAKIGRDLRNRLFERVTSFSDAEVQRFSAASLITRGTNDVQQVQMVSIMLMRMVLYAPIMAVGGVYMVLVTDAHMGWVIVAAVAVVFLVVMVLFKVAVPKFRLMQRLIDRVNLVAREILTGMTVVRAFNRQGHEEQRFDKASGDLMRTQLFTTRVMSLMQPIMMLVMNGVSVLIVWVGAGYVDTGTMQVGSVIASITYAMQIIMSFLIISMVAIMLPRANVAAERVNEVIGTVPSVADPKESADDRLGKGAGACLTFDDVGFAYPGSEEPVLSHVSFDVPAGTTTAIVGATGSGKSTLLKLAMRMHDVTQGSVRVDGVDVRDLSQHALRTALAYVPQKAFLFSGTVAENVAYSDAGMPRKRVEQALSTSQSASFVDGMTGGEDAYVSQGGVNVSGGQRQRLAIARALASRGRALLFDDSFSALDFATDAALRQALERDEPGRTKVVVAQRVSTVLSADQIVVLDEGRVVGKGTHDELMRDCEVYRQIAESQLSAAELAGGDVA